MRYNSNVSEDHAYLLPIKSTSNTILTYKNCPQYPTNHLTSQLHFTQQRAGIKLLKLSQSLAKIRTSDLQT
jgi:hypothetical protein